MISSGGYGVTVGTQNHYLQPSEFAFSDPTPSGIKFASQYMGSEEFLVYNR